MLNVNLNVIYLVNPRCFSNIKHKFCVCWIEYDNRYFDIAFTDREFLRIQRVLEHRFLNWISLFQFFLLENIDLMVFL